jgi:hypothetical protein
MRLRAVSFGFSDALTRLATISSKPHAQIPPATVIHCVASDLSAVGEAEGNIVGDIHVNPGIDDERVGCDRDAGDNERRTVTNRVCRKRQGIAEGRLKTAASEWRGDKVGEDRVATSERDFEGTSR